MNTVEIIPSVINKAVASVVLTSDQTNVAEDETVTVGSVVYTFKDTPSAAYEVEVGADADTSLQNLVDAINGDLSGTTAHPLVTASDVDTHATTITAQNIGYAGNSIASTETSAHLSFATATLAGGVGGPLNGVTINGDANGDTVYSDPIDMSYYDEAIAFLNVTDHDGTTPTLDVSFEVSPDGVTWMASGDAFAQVETTDAMILKRLTANFGKWVRAKLVTAGTNPAYTLALYIMAKG